MSIIYIDCGHNAKGTDRGARCADGRMENDLNQAVSARLAALLSAAGHAVTRIGNDSTGIVERGALAAENKCDLLLSIHHNAFGHGANGTSVIKSVVFAFVLPPVIRALRRFSYRFGSSPFEY